MIRNISLALVVLTLACFGLACRGDFINLDDPLYITRNPHVLGGLTSANVHWAFTDSCYWAGYWIPLTWLSLQADATIFGPQAAWGFHLTNLLLHVSVVVLFFLVLQRMTGEVGASALAAALFAIHPLRVESVAWATERKDMLSTLFLLLTIGAYDLYANRPGWGRYGLVFLCFFLGLMAKPTLVTLPIALLLLDYWPLYRLQLGQPPPAQHAAAPRATWQWLVAEKLPLLAAAIAVSSMTLHFANAVEAVRVEMGWKERLMVAAAGYLGYLENSFWPFWPNSLAVLYPLRIPTPGRVALAAFVLGLITWGLVRLGRQKPALIVGWLWFLGTLFPVSGVVQVGPQALADRYTYVPHLGLAIVVVWGVADLAVWRRLSSFVKGVALAAGLAGLGFLTVVQVMYWHDSGILFDHTLRVTKDNYEIHDAFSAWLFAKGRVEQAEQENVKALELSPHRFDSRLRYGVLLANQERNAEAEPQLREAVRLKPESPDARYILGTVLVKLGRRAEARVQMQQALACWDADPHARPMFGDSDERRAWLYSWIGDIALYEGKPQEALDYFARAIRVKPDLAEAFQLRGIALGRLNQWAEAATALAKAVELEPDNPFTRGYLAYAHVQQGKTEQARQEFADLIKRSPDWTKAGNDLALQIIANPKLGDRRKAEEMATQICAATGGKDAHALDTLAAVEAANGDFPKARATAAKALDCVTDPALAGEIRERLLWYEKNQPLPATKDQERP